VFADDDLARGCWKLLTLVTPVWNRRKTEAGCVDD
jgi:hypothetical protein